jgi:hypothetical protein
MVHQKIENMKNWNFFLFSIHFLVVGGTTKKWIENKKSLNFENPPFWPHLLKKKPDKGYIITLHFLLRKVFC